MYTSYFELKSKPFQISSDPAFIWLGEKHREALATLKYGILDNKGFMLLTGDVGTGKTTLINTLIESLRDDVLYASVPDPRLVLDDFLAYVARAFEIEAEFSSKGKFLLHFGAFLEKAYANDKKVLLLVDESQLLTQDLLEEIRLLSNIQKDGNHLLNIFFVGQNEFNEVLYRPENRAVAQRLTLNYNLEPLSFEETEQYVRHRLQVAGTTRKIFSPEAIQEIHTYSGGFPRRINILCDHCLLKGFVREMKAIDGATVIDCANDLKIPASNMPATPPPATNYAEQPAMATIQPARHVEELPPNQLYSPKLPEREELPLKPARSYMPWLVFAGILLLLLLFMPDRFISTSKYIGSYLFTLPKQKIESTVTSGEEPAGGQQSFAPAGIGKGGGTIKVQDGAFDSQVAGNTAGSEPQLPASVAKRGDVNTGQDSVAMVVGESKTGSVLQQPAKRAAVTEPVNTAPQKGLLQESSTISGDLGEGAKVFSLPQETVRVGFDHNASDFYSADIDQLERIAESVKAHPSAIVLISGFTDSSGNEVYNKTLSLFRANMIKSFLLGYGLQANRIEVQGLGSEKPLGSNASEAGRKLNRRVEIDVIVR